MSSKIRLSLSARRSTRRPDLLEKQAASVVDGLTVPEAIDFAKFDHAGRTYAISVRVLVDVEFLPNRVPDVVIRTGDRRFLHHPK